eukprot:CAMPEP_0182864918 /NCGR_PEP_ID=MMETSP0034_2-20130328/7418_1 /TAXON_ID=156128 /ORGANISM="Nephroselmis pyriformis, Strain CCMP717" /LENGTH=222 /DNA_ID=CAMNT_0024997191 /DNA_START=49 /DNA_END=714 /DNA_ORIENTATION=+
MVFALHALTTPRPPCHLAVAGTGSRRGGACAAVLRGVLPAPPLRATGLGASRLSRGRSRAAAGSPENGLATMSDIISELSEPLPDEMLKTLYADNGKPLPYIPWFTAQKILDQHAPGWCGEVRNVVFSPRDGSVTVTYRVSVPTADCGLVYRDATGTEPATGAGGRSFGDPTQRAEQQAFRRACARFGLGLYLYGIEGFGEGVSPPPPPVAGRGAGRGGGRG